MQPQIAAEVLKLDVLLTASNPRITDIPADVDEEQEGGGYMLSRGHNIWDDYDEYDTN